MEEKKSRSFISILQSLCVLYITIWTIAPPLQIDNIYRIAALGAVGLWFLLNIPQKVTLERIHILAIIFAMLVMIVALMDSGGRFRKILDPINYYMLVITFIMGYCYKDRWHELSWMIPIILLLLVYFNFQTYKTVLDDPSVARTLVRNDASAYHYMRRGVGGYGLLYPQVCILPIIVSWTISAFRKHWVRFAIGVLWIISFFLYLFNAGYSIAVAASIVSLIILFFYRRSSMVLAIIITTVLIAIIVWLIGYNAGFREWLISIFDGTKVATKINDLYLSITTADTADSIMVRIIRYKASIETIFTYPIIGGLWFPDGGGGGHSAILDTFAKYGLFGGVIFVRMLFHFSITLKKSPQIKKDIFIANSIFITVLMVALFNSMPFNYVCMIMLIIPSAYDNIINWRHVNENSLDSKSDSERSLAKTKYTV